MITRIEADKISERLAFRQSYFAVKQWAQAQIYGDRCDFWLHGEGVLLSRLTGAFTLCGEGASPALPELLAFLEYMGGPVEGDSPLMEKLFPGSTQRFSILAAPAAAPTSFPPQMQLTEAQRLTPVYTFLCESDKAFAVSSSYESWLTDFSHRCRHRFSKCFLLKEHHEIIATVSILFQNPNYALIGALAVRPDKRTRGLGPLLLAHTTALCREQGQLPLIAAEEALAAYYRRHGWTDYGEAARYQHKEDL